MSHLRAAHQLYSDLADLPSHRLRSCGAWECPARVGHGGLGCGFEPPRNGREHRMWNPVTAEDPAGMWRPAAIAPFDGMWRAAGQAKRLRCCVQRGCGRCPARTRPWSPIWCSGPSPAARRRLGSVQRSGAAKEASALHRRMRASLPAGWLPFMHAADCSVLLAAVPALGDVAGRASWVFLDGHEDATPMDLAEWRTWRSPCS